MNNENTVQGVVYNTLKDGIMTLQLEPGTTMSTQEMATRLQVSRTPVREAFIRLQREGLVYMIPQRETMVSHINLKRVEEERFIRESLELAVIKPFLQNCFPEHFAKLRSNISEQEKCYKEKRYADFVHNDNLFHQLLFEVAGQSLAWITITNVNGHYNRIRTLTVRNKETIVGTIHQHSQIVDMMERGDIDSVYREMSDHVQKINCEKTDLIQQYPDYFITGENPTGIQIGSL